MNNFLPTAARRVSLLLLLALGISACNRTSYPFQFRSLLLPTEPITAPALVRVADMTDTLTAGALAPAPTARKRPAHHKTEARHHLYSMRLAVALTHAISQPRQAQTVARHQASPPDQPEPVRYRSRGIAFLLNILPMALLGIPGAHSFYLGRPGRGAAQIALTGLALLLIVIGIINGIFSGGGSALFAIALGAVLYTGVFIWQLVDAILILTGDLKPKNGDYYPRFFQTRPDAAPPKP